MDTDTLLVKYSDELSVTEFQELRDNVVSAFPEKTVFFARADTEVAELPALDDYTDEVADRVADRIIERLDEVSNGTA